MRRIARRRNTDSCIAAFVAPRVSNLFGTMDFSRWVAGVKLSLNEEAAFDVDDNLPPEVPAVYIWGQNARRENTLLKPTQGILTPGTLLPRKLTRWVPFSFRELCQYPNKVRLQMHNAKEFAGSHPTIACDNSA